MKYTMGGAEGRVEVWTEVLSSGISVLWAWDGHSLGAIVTTHDGYRIEEESADAIGRYADDKETNLIVKDMYDDSDFEGSLEDYVEEELKT